MRVKREKSWFEIIVYFILAAIMLILGFGLSGCSNQPNQIKTVFDEDVESSTVNVEGVEFKVDNIKLMKVSNYDGSEKIGDDYLISHWLEEFDDKNYFGDEFYIVEFNYNITNNNDVIVDVSYSDDVEIDGQGYGYWTKGSSIDAEPNSNYQEVPAAFIIPMEDMTFDKDSHFEIYIYGVEFSDANKEVEVSFDQIPPVVVN